MMTKKLDSMHILCMALLRSNIFIYSIILYQLLSYRKAILIYSHSNFHLVS